MNPLAQRLSYHRMAPTDGNPALMKRQRIRPGRRIKFSTKRFYLPVKTLTGEVSRIDPRRHLYWVEVNDSIEFQIMPEEVICTL